MAVVPQSTQELMTPEATRRPSSALPLSSSSPPPAASSLASFASFSHRRGPSCPPSFASAMAAVPSSSKPSPSRSVHRPRRDVFKPKFPLDPFAGASAAALGEPWFLKIDALLSATAQQRRNVIFVLGGAYSILSLRPCSPILSGGQPQTSQTSLPSSNPAISQSLSSSLPPTPLQTSLESSSQLYASCVSPLH